MVGTVYWAAFIGAGDQNARRRHEIKPRCGFRYRKVGFMELYREEGNRTVRWIFDVLMSI